MQCSTWGSVDNPSSATATDDYRDPDSPIESSLWMMIAVITTCPKRKMMSISYLLG